MAQLDAMRLAQPGRRETAATYGLFVGATLLTIGWVGLVFYGVYEVASALLPLL